MNQYNGDRSFQMVIRTGEDVRSQQMLREASPLGAVVNNGHLHVIFLGLWTNAKPITANTVYHVVATFNKATMRAKLYVAGAFVSESSPRETEATYGIYLSIGNNRPANNPVYPFQGVITLNRDFNYELTAEEVMSLDNNGDPAGYVLPASMKPTTNSYVNLQSPMTPGGWLQYQPSVPFEIVDGAIAVTYPVEANKGYQNGLYHRLDKVIPRSYRFILRFKAKADVDRSLIRVFVGGGIAELHFSQEVTLSTEFTEYVLFANKTWNPGFPDNMHFVGFYPIYNKPATDKYYIKDVSVIPIGCIAEYMPQNIIISHKRDFPQVTLPISGYTPSSGVFLINSASSTTESMNLPQANGFSGKYMRFDAVTGISLYCAYWYTYLKKRLPIKITFEYRANRTIYASQQSIAPTASDAVAIDANEGDAQIASVTYGIGGSAYMFSAADTEAWLEMRVLAIEVVEDVCLGWLDSAQQLPLNDEYLPPLLETAGGYDLTANGTPDIVYKMTQWAYIIPNLMDDGTGHSNPYLGLYFNNDQQDATYYRVDGKIVANIGSYSSPTNRPMLIYYRFNFIPGRYYRISIKWSLISGSYFLEAFNNWSTDSYEYTGDSLHTEPGNYEYTTPLLKAADVMTNSYRPTFFFKTRQAHSEFSIDEIIIEGYE